MPGRTFGAEARYGFNGKERDKDINSLTAYDYGFRIYNPAIGKFLCVDPLTSEYPELTPYQYASNTPIESIDLDGLESFSSKKAYMRISMGYNPTLSRLENAKVFADANSPNIPIWIGDNIKTKQKIILINAMKDCNCEVIGSKYETEVANFDWKAEDVKSSDMMTDEEKKYFYKRNLNLAGKAGTSVQGELSNRARPLPKAIVDIDNAVSRSQPIGVREGRMKTIDRGITAVTFVAKIFAYSIREHQKTIFNLQIKASSNVISFMQNVIDGNVPGASIPVNMRNQSDLSSIANFLFKGDIKYLDDSNGNQTSTENASVMSIARNLLRTMNLQLDPSIGQKMENVQNPTDNKISSTNRTN